MTHARRQISIPICCHADIQKDLHVAQAVFVDPACLRVVNDPSAYNQLFDIAWKLALVQSRLVAWVMMLPVVLFAAPAIRRLTNVLMQED